MKKYYFLLIMFLSSMVIYAQIPSLNAVTDLKNRKWISAEAFSSKTLYDQKEIHMSVYANDLTTAKTPVIWIEGEDLIIRYPDGYITKIAYKPQTPGNGIVLYPVGKEGKSLNYDAVYVSTGNFFTLYLK